MSSLKEINLRINSLKNTKKITEAMKLIAITKLSRAQANVNKSKNYYAYLQEILFKVRDAEAFKEHILINENRATKKIKLLLFTSDKGLCGPFNSNIIKFAKKFIAEKKSAGLEVRTEHFGRKGYEALKKENVVEKWYEEVFRDDSFNLKSSEEMLSKRIASFLKEDLDEYYLIYNKFQSVLKQIPVAKKIIPLGGDRIEDSNKETKAGANQKKQLNYIPNFIFEPNKEAVVEAIIKKIIYFELFYAYLNTIAGENSARMTAMDSATNNCNDMIDRFTLERNQLRQANITKELVEIISGAESV